MNNWLSRSIAKKLLIAFLGIFVATYLATAMVVFTSVRSSIVEAQGDALETIANQRVSSLFTSIEALNTNLQAWAKLDVMNDIPSGDVDKQITASLEQLKLGYLLKGNIFVFDFDDVLIASSSMTDGAAQLSRPPQWSTKERSTSFIDKSFNPFETGSSVALTLPIQASFDQGLRLGTLVATIPWDAIDNQLKGDDSHAILFDRTRRRVEGSYGIALDPADISDLLMSQTRRLDIGGGRARSGLFVSNV